MSRIGKLPISLPKGVTIAIDGNTVKVKGPKGELARTFADGITIGQEGETLQVKRASDEVNHKALHGLSRTLLANMVEGVTKGYQKTLEISGVGYKAEVKPFGLQLALRTLDDNETLVHLQVNTRRNADGAESDS